MTSIAYQASIATRDDLLRRAAERRRVEAPGQRRIVRARRRVSRAFQLVSA
jgi:hypothetical protein